MRAALDVAAVRRRFKAPAAQRNRCAWTDARLVRRLWTSGVSCSAHAERDGLDYSPAKTVGDCSQFRTTVGLDTALSALKALRRRRGFDTEDLLRFAKICRVERLVRSYLEALL